MHVNWTQPTLDAIKWLRDNFVTLRNFVADYPRLRNKIDKFSVTGAQDFVNRADTMSMLIAPSSNRTAPVASTWKLLRVQSAASGGGKYYGVILQPAATLPTASGNLSAANLGTVPSPATQVLILNAAEVGQSTHGLTETTVIVTDFFGEYRGVNSSGEMVFVINGYDNEAC